MPNVIDKDLGWKRIKSKMNFIDGKELKAGVLPDAGNEKNGKPIAQVASWNEYGTPATSRRPWSVPARPFMAISCDEHNGWQKDCERAVNGILGGAEVISKLNGIGEQMKKDIKSVIGDKSKLTPNKPSTIAKKGHDIPLMDTGSMYDAINYEVK